MIWRSALSASERRQEVVSIQQIMDTLKPMSSINYSKVQEVIPKLTVALAKKKEEDEKTEKVARVFLVYCSQKTHRLCNQKFIKLLRDAGVIKTNKQSHLADCIFAKFCNKRSLDLAAFQNALIEFALRTNVLMSDLEKRIAELPGPRHNNSRKLSVSSQIDIKISTNKNETAVVKMKSTLIELAQIAQHIPILAASKNCRHNELDVAREKYVRRLRHAAQEIEAIANLISSSTCSEEEDSDDQSPSSSSSSSS